MISKKILFSLLLFFSGLSANAAVIATYDLNAANGANLPVAATDPAYTWSNFSAVNVSANAFDNHFYFDGWGATFDTSKYLSVTVTKAGSYRLGSMSFSVEASSPDSGTVVVRSSKDGFTADIDSFSWTGDLVTNGTLDLTAAGNLSGATELRFYFFVTGFGAFGFANHEPPGAGAGLPDVGRDVIFNDAPVVGASITSVPTLSEWAMTALTALMALATFASMRRRIS